MKPTSKIMRVAGVLVIFVAITGQLFAKDKDKKPKSVPEIDPATATSALALLGGAMLLVKGRKK